MLQTESLTKRAGAAVIWTTLSTGAIQLSGVVKTIVLARLLSRDDFGIVGVGMITLSAIEAVTNTGFTVAILQQKAPSESSVHTAYTVGLIRGAILSVVMLLLAPWIGGFFHSPGSVAVIRWMALSVILTAVSSMGRIDLQRRLLYRENAKIEITASIADMTSAVLSALVMRSAYALVIGLIARQLVNAVGYFIIHPWRPKMQVVWRDLVELMRFGRWISLTLTLWFLSDQLDRTLVGRLLGLEQLGLYVMAGSLANVPYTAVQFIVNRVVFSSYVEISQDQARLSRVFERVMLVIFSLSVCVTVICFQFGDALVPAVLGQKWRPVTKLLNILLAAGVIRALAVDAASQLFVAVGKPAYQTIANVIRLVVFSAVVYPAYLWKQSVGVAWATLLAATAAGLVSAIFTRSLVQVTLRPLLIFVLNIAVPVAVAAVCGYLVRQFGGDGVSGSWLGLGAWAFGFFSTYLVMQSLTRRFPQTSVRAFLIGV